MRGRFHLPIEPGARFGGWEVVEYDCKIDGSSCYLCRCDCGYTKTIPAKSLRSGKSSQCRSCASRKHPGFTPAQNDLYRVYHNSATRRGFSFDIDRDQFIKLTSLNCHYCGGEPSNVMVKKDSRNKSQYVYNGIDRVDNTIGYELSNCVPCCKTCNYAKHTMTYGEWMAYIKRLTQYQNQTSYSSPLSRAA
jgi:hypothetical protein